MRSNIYKLLSITLCLTFSINLFPQEIKNHEQFDDRAYWVDLAYQMAAPVLSNMSKGELRKNMPIEYSPTWDNRNSQVAYMETFGRLMVGIAPWLALPDDDTLEGKKRKQLREWALLSYTNAVDPDSPDYLLWGGANQVLVDAAFLANSFIRAPEALWHPLDKVTKERYIKEFNNAMKIRPFFNNWILFRSIIDAFLLMIDEEYDIYSLDSTIRRINDWYIGDGWYTDGPDFALDYYNSFVIHPMFVEIIDIMGQKDVFSPVRLDLALRRMQRYNQQMERLIAPDASFPAIGRSMTYRMGAFQTLALSAWKYGLPATMTNGQVRNALTSVMRRMFSVEGNFCEKGFLTLGFVGHQPELADSYVNNGSVYLTSIVFLPLGLPADHDFWTAPAEDWTSRKIWNGETVRRDYKESIRQ
ncbi:MAG: DUF2264 domain-containing protein [Dysgonamonadaceae bacterium]|jgi:hypothetical protein|nr:DUF2264 domain-containing protein [Dysgonamonadaceae bacterium]